MERAEDIPRANRKVLGYIWKETDGIYAAWNKKLALPLIRALARTPISPNVISLLGLVVAIAAGALFAQGRYSLAVAGALLAYLSSLLDHCDGSVARIKHQESAFGCWLETACDYGFYLSIATGWTLGLHRQTGNPVYLAWVA
ncbi:MAG: CDP-alcohol phosphatidyltransferase family protein [Acidobacteria bacterium]|nr:CDP-alcohol phosphatidyltransferase family protein [Acidobacteriota bacterium]